LQRIAETVATIIRAYYYAHIRHHLEFSSLLRDISFPSLDFFASERSIETGTGLECNTV
jgi:hypothetical protein